MPKVIVVTGGNRGIGLEICRQLHKLGHRTIMGSRDPDKGMRISGEMGNDVTTVKLDVTSETNIQDLKTYLEHEFGHLDVLINNAGIGMGSKGSVEADLSEVRMIMETNFYGAWRLSQVLIPLLQQSRSGRIINVSSGMGALDDLTGGWAGYRLSKSSMNALTILMSNELKSSGVSVNAMCPGWVRTDMGGPSAPVSVGKGAETAVWLALEDHLPVGKFFRDKKMISW